MINHILNVASALIREHIIKKVTRSDKWPAARKLWLKNNSICAACNSTQFLQVHHVKPFHDDPALELDPTNYITLCMSTNECHIRLGHGGSFKKFNPNVRKDCAEAIVNPSNLLAIIERAKDAALPNVPGE